MKLDEDFPARAEPTGEATEKPRHWKRVLLFTFGVFVLALLGAGGIYYSVRGSFAPLLVSVATKIVPLLGDNLPELPSPFGKLHISSRRSDKGVFIEIACKPCRLGSEKIGPLPFLVDEGKVSGLFEKGTFRGSLDSEGLSVPINGTWDGESFRGDFHLPETPIAKLYTVARSIVPEAGTPVIEGTVSGSGSFQWPQAFIRWRPKVSKFRVSGLVNLHTYAKGSFSYPATDKDEKPIVLQSGELTEDWVPWAGLGKYLPAAAVAAEDGTFYSHPGFDVRSMDEALKENEVLKRLRRGASTITQQLAKNLFLSREKSYSRKLRELLYAVNLEQLGKRRILELYLNIVEWGPGIHGAKQAARTFFRKAPAELLPEEAAWLAAILRSPRRSWKKEYATGTPNVSRIEKILSRMPSLTDEERSGAMGRKLTLSR